MKKCITFILFVVGVLLIGGLMGSLFTPGLWYESLQKPSFTPPNWLFAPVWIILYIMIAIAGWRVFVLYNNISARVLWCIQMALNFIWMPVFFGAQLPILAMIVMIALVVSVSLFIVKALDTDKISSLLFLPYLVWIIVASYLNAGVILLN